MKPATDRDIFYHALYHLVAHWAVFGATLALLITIGITGASAQQVRAHWFFRAAILTTAAGSLFMLWRMWTFGNIVNAYLGTAADRTRWLPGPLKYWLGGSLNLWLAALVTAVIAVCAWRALPAPPRAHSSEGVSMPAVSHTEGHQPAAGSPPPSPGPTPTPASSNEAPDCVKTPKFRVRWKMPAVFSSKSKAPSLKSA